MFKRICKHSGPVEVRCAKCPLLSSLLLFFRWLLYLDKHFDGCYPEGKATHAEPVYATGAAMCTCINPLIWKRKTFDISYKTTNKGLGLNASLSVPVGNRTCVFRAWLSTVFSWGHVRFIILKNATKRKKKREREREKKKREKKKWSCWIVTLCKRYTFCLFLLFVKERKKKKEMVLLENIRFLFIFACLFVCFSLIDHIL